MIRRSAMGAAAGVGGAPVSRAAPPTGAPHEAQNRAPGVRASPQAAHPLGVTGVPQDGQNRAPCGTASPQARQTTSPPVMV